MTKNRAQKIKDKLLDEIYKNGGHWKMINMKNGNKVTIQRLAFTSFEYLDRDFFKVDENEKRIFHKASIEEIAEYIDKNY